MTCPNKATFLSVVFKLMERGLSGDQIDAAMREMVGNDWRELPVSTWLARLQDNDYIREIDKNLYLEELEVLIKRRTSSGGSDSMKLRGSGPRRLMTE